MALPGPKAAQPEVTVPSASRVETISGRVKPCVSCTALANMPTKLTSGTFGSNPVAPAFTRDAKARAPACATSLAGSGLRGIWSRLRLDPAMSRSYTKNWPARQFEGLH